MSVRSVDQSIWMCYRASVGSTCRHPAGMSSLSRDDDPPTYIRLWSPESEFPTMAAGLIIWQ